MSTHIDLLPTLTGTSGWVRVALPSGRTFLVNKTPTGTCTYIPEQPAVSRDAAGRPRVALTLLLSRMPTFGDASIAPLVIGGSLALTCSLAAGSDDLAALQAQLGTQCSPLFIRGGSGELRDVEKTYAHSDLLGSAPQFWLGTWLPAQQALDVLRSFDRIQSELYVETRIEGSPAPAVQPVALDALLGGVLDGMDRTRYVSMVVLQADGTATPVPTAVREIPQDHGETRDAPKPLAMVATQHQLVAVPFAMTPSTAVQPSAAALAAGGATGPATRLTAHSIYWLGNDAIIPVDDGGDDNTPTEHLPEVSAPGAPYWSDAIDSQTAWYAPAFVPVLPAPNDDPGAAAFAFEFSRSGTTLGSGGVQTGLTATVRITVEQVMSAETKQALAAAGSLTAKPVPLTNLSIGLEIPYRQPGSSTPVTQRFPGTAVQNGDRLVVSVPLLDDWVRLAYSALAYPPASGFPAPRLIVDYSFQAYAWAAVGGVHVVNGGKVQQMASVMTREELPPDLEKPTLVASDLAVVGPRSYVQYRREAPLSRGVPLTALQTPNLGILVDRPQLAASSVAPAVQRRLLVRSIVREEEVDLQFPCGSLGAFYLQVAADGTTMTAVGCQDALKLGETAGKAFEEVSALRDPSYRVYRSLQQPGRFLLVPGAYRVGRYAASEGSKAFRPMILLYGVLDADPTKNRYALAATLIADVSAYHLALLTSALRAYAPAGATPTLVLPTDPFIGAGITYAWTIPNGLDQPEAISVLDNFNVTLSMAMDQAALLTTVIEHSGVQGKVSFALPDGTAFDAALVIDNTIIGPPDTGPVTADIAGGTATLTNRTQQTMNVLDVALVDGAGKATSSAASVTLAPGATSSQPATAGAVRAAAEATAADHPPLDELDIFVEDVTMSVSFIDQINFANHGLTALRVQARLKDGDNLQEANLPENQVATVTFTLPITTYLSVQALEYALIETTASGSTTTAWREWDLTKGTVVGITADLL